MLEKDNHLAMSNNGGTSYHEASLTLSDAEITSRCN